MTAKELTAVTEALISSGELLNWRSGMCNNRLRQLFVTPNVWTALQRGWESLPGEAPKKTDARKKALHSLMYNWLQGIPIEFERDLKPLEPWEEGIWEFRVNSPKPGSRLFGFIPDTNVFVAVGFHNRERLGISSSPEWRGARNLALREWSRLYPNKRSLACPPSMRDPVGIKEYWHDKTA